VSKLDKAEKAIGWVERVLPGLVRIGKAIAEVLPRRKLRQERRARRRGEK
jgi:hypothetical protein